MQDHAASQVFCLPENFLDNGVFVDTTIDWRATDSPGRKRDLVEGLPPGVLSQGCLNFAQGTAIALAAIVLDELVVVVTLLRGQNLEAGQGRCVSPCPSWTSNCLCQGSANFYRYARHSIAVQSLCIFEQDQLHRRSTAADPGWHVIQPDRHDIQCMRLQSNSAGCEQQEHVYTPAEWYRPHLSQGAHAD